MNDRKTRLLALDGSTPACTVALVIDGKPRELFEVGENLHSRRMLPMINELLTDAGLKPSDLDCIGIGIGPGSFTGLRIAVGIAQGLAAASGIPVVPVSSLAALAQACPPGRILAGLDARMREVYWACFERSAGEAAVQPVGVERVSKPELVELPKEGEWLGVGTGWDPYRSALSPRLLENVRFSPGLQYPHATDIAVVSEKEFEAGNAIAAAELTPSYVRNDVAKKPAVKTR